MEISGAAAWLNTVFAAFDQWAAVWVHNLYAIGGGFFTPFFEAISWLAHDGIPLIVISVVLMLFPKTRKYGTAMLLGIGIGALVTNLCLKVLIARPRPYSDETAQFFKTDLYQTLWNKVGRNMESDKSFPSGHTTAAFGAMTALFFMGNKKVSWLAFLFAGLMAIARIYLVVHFASDVLAGILVGFPSGLLAAFIAKKLPQVYYDFDFGISKRKKTA